MSIRTFIAASAVVAGTFMATAASAECAVDTTDPYELDDAGVAALYDCIKEDMAAAYAKGGDETGINYRSWEVAQTQPAIAGTHGNRFVQTFANDIAAPEYLKFAEEGVVMPVGSILAKESFSINKKKSIGRVGPLFTMIKVEAGGDAAEYGNWVYGGIQPNGKPLKIKQSFCHDCHGAYETQDALAYAPEEYRVSQ